MLRRRGRVSRRTGRAGESPSILCTPSPGIRSGAVCPDPSLTAPISAACSYTQLRSDPEHTGRLLNREKSRQSGQVRDRRAELSSAIRSAPRATPHGPASLFTATSERRRRGASLDWAGTTAAASDHGPMHVRRPDPDLLPLLAPCDRSAGFVEEGQSDGSAARSPPVSPAVPRRSSAGVAQDRDVPATMRAPDLRLSGHDRR